MKGEAKMTIPALQRIKNIEKIGRKEGGYASTDDEFLLKAFNFMRAIAMENCSRDSRYYGYPEIDKEFEKRMLK